MEQQSRPDHSPCETEVAQTTTQTVSAGAASASQFKQVYPNRLHDSYEANLNEGDMFEDFVASCMWAHNMPVHLHRSLPGQQKSEGITGYEIKFDRKLHDKGNYFIETRERAGLNLPWKPSGIYQGDIHGLVIGDYSHFAIISINHLIEAHESGVYRVVFTETAEGFLLPSHTRMPYLEFETDYDPLGADYWASLDPAPTYRTKKYQKKSTEQTKDRAQRAM